MRIEEKVGRPTECPLEGTDTGKKVKRPTIYNILTSTSKTPELKPLNSTEAELEAYPPLTPPRFKKLMGSFREEYQVSHSTSASPSASVSSLSSDTQGTGNILCAQYKYTMFVRGVKGKIK